MGLRRYHEKRDFARTPEPRGATAKRRGAGGAFVVQKHDATRLHYDFRLEMEGVLRSWAVPKGPSLDPGEKRLAVHVEDHPLAYGSFEGVIPEGEYGGGPVIVWDRGRWEPEGDPVAAYEKGHLSFTLAGEKLRGAWTLVRMRGRDGSEKNWLLIKAKDAEARSGKAAEITVARPESVKTGRAIEALDGKGAKNGRAAKAAAPARRASASRTRPPGPASPRGANAAPPAREKEEGKEKGRARAALKGLASLEGVERAALPASFSPQLASLVDETPEGDEWIHEIKFDGYRILGFVENGQARLVSRNGKVWTSRYPRVAEALASLPAKAALLDGELVVVRKDGTTDFQALQRAGAEGKDAALRYYAFDLLHLDGLDLAAVPLLSRKEALRSLLAGSNGPLLYAAHVRGRGGRFHEEACRMGLEGTVSKKADGPYRAGKRTPEWRKVRCGERQEFVIGGYVRHSADRTGVGALLVGVYDAKGGLAYAGRVGTGFDAASRRDLKRRLDALPRDASPFAGEVDDAREVTFAKPELVAEVKFTEWTQDGRLRHPSFAGLREDKAPGEVVRERGGASPAEGPPARAASREEDASRAPRPAGRGARAARPAADASVLGVRLSHPEKVLWPGQGVTKRALASYYEAVAERMLPHVAGRPLMLLRCPEGEGKPCFVQKHLGEETPEGLVAIDVVEGGEERRYAAVEDAAGLVSLVQRGVLEVHVWGSRRDRLDRADVVVFDLDPAPDVAFARVAEAALALRERLRGLGLPSFVKTTGGKGLHVEVPIARAHPWDEVKEFTRLVAESFAREQPDRFVATASKAKRGGRIFVDWLRNARGATAVAPYSSRARAGAPVAMPIAWDRVGPRLDPAAFTVETVPALVARGADPWAGFGDAAPRLAKALATLRRESPGPRSAT